MWLLYASLSAAAFGLRGILYHHLSDKPLDRHMLLTGVFFTGCLLSLILAVITRQPWTAEAFVGIMMGTCSTLSNLSMFRGFAAGRASIVAVLTALPPVVVALLAWMIWGERLTTGQTLALFVIVGGVIIIRYARDFTLAHWESAKWGLLAMLFFGLNDMSGKWSTMLGAPLFPLLFWMFLTGTVLFAAAWLSGRRRASAERAEKAAIASAPDDPADAAWTSKRTFGIGMLVGLTNAGGMMLIVTAFESGVTGLVSGVVALNVLLILLYARLVAGERFVPRELTGMAMAIGGVLMLRLLG